MAILAGCNINAPARKGGSGPDGLAAPQLGVSATITLTGASAVTIALPTDANGRLYPAYQVTADEAVWIAFCSTSGDAATIGGANNYLLGQNNTYLIGTPQAILSVQQGAFISGIANAGTAGHICVTGIF
jgi:hypothetical protein